MWVEAIFNYYAVNDRIQSDTAGQAVAVLQDLHYSFPILMPASKKLADSLMILSYPTVIVIDKDKNILFQGDLETAESLIAKIL